MKFLIEQTRITKGLQTDVKAGIQKRHQARENMQAVQSAGKHAYGAKLGKYADTKRGETCNRCQARKNDPSKVEVAFGFGFSEVVYKMFSDCSAYVFSASNT